MPLPCRTCRSRNFQWSNRSARQWTVLDVSIMEDGVAVHFQQMPCNSLCWGTGRRPCTSSSHPSAAPREPDSSALVLGHVFAHQWFKNHTTRNPVAPLCHHHPHEAVHMTRRTRCERSRPSLHNPASDHPSAGQWHRRSREQAKTALVAPRPPACSASTRECQHSTPSATCCAS